MRSLTWITLRQDLILSLLVHMLHKITTNVSKIIEVIYNFGKS